MLHNEPLGNFVDKVDVVSGRCLGSIAKMSRSQDLGYPELQASAADGLRSQADWLRNEERSRTIRITNRAVKYVSHG
jgi:hypothetical protein